MVPSEAVQMLNAATSLLHIYRPTEAIRVAGWSKLGPMAAGPGSPRLMCNHARPRGMQTDKPVVGGPGEEL